MRASSVFGLMLLMLLVAAGSAGAACLRYEPAVVDLVGTLVERTYPGPPNYEGIAGGDSTEHAFVLVLRAPICVVGDPESELNSESYDGVVEVHIWSTEVDLKPLIGKAAALRTPVILRAVAARAG